MAKDDLSKHVFKLIFGMVTWRFLLPWWFWCPGFSCCVDFLTFHHVWTISRLEYQQVKYWNRSSILHIWEAGKKSADQLTLMGEELKVSESSKLWFFWQDSCACDSFLARKFRWRQFSHHWVSMLGQHYPAEFILSVELLNSMKCCQKKSWQSIVKLAGCRDWQRSTLRFTNIIHPHVIPSPWGFICLFYVLNSWHRMKIHSHLSQNVSLVGGVVVTALILIRMNTVKKRPWL